MFYGQFANPTALKPGTSAWSGTSPMAPAPAPVPPTVNVMGGSYQPPVPAAPMGAPPPSPIVGLGSFGFGSPTASPPAAMLARGLMGGANQRFR